MSAKDLLEQVRSGCRASFAIELALRADLLEAVARIEVEFGSLDAAEHSAVLAIELRAGRRRQSGRRPKRRSAPCASSRGSSTPPRSCSRFRRELVAASVEPLVLARVESDLGQVKFLAQGERGGRGDRALGLGDLT
ncbi:MAG: hypothetical protein R2862_01130 [Thermoanaerobaculia bacterium]